MIVRKILTTILLIILFSCTKDQVYIDESNLDCRSNLLVDSSYNNVYGNWIVVYYENLESGSIISKSDVDSWGGMDIKIKFMDDSTFCGFNTTNEIAGHYFMHDSTLNINVYGGTKVGQPKWGDMFSDIVHSHLIKSFKRSNTKLKLYYNNNKNCVVLYPLRKNINCHFTYSNK